MSRRFLVGPIALTTAILLLLACTTSRRAPAAEDKKPAESATTTKDVFGLTRILAIDLTLSAKEYDALQPTGGFGFPGGPAPPRPKDKRDRERNLFGIEFPWCEGDLVVGGKTLKKVGLRYDGNATWFSAGPDIRKPFHIQLDRHAKQQFQGLSRISLHPGVMDPSRSREVLACSVFRAAGVPAPRTAFAEVTLTVPGKYDKEYLGLYTLVENVDGKFLTDHFGTDKGLLMKPFQVRGVEYPGDDWERYKDHYRPLSEPTKEQARRVIGFAKLVNQAGDDEFEKEIGSYLDVDAFLRFLAANALTANLENVFALGHNYYLYLHPKTNKFVFIPGDLEFALANFLLLGSGDELMDLSLTRPYPGDNKLVERLLGHQGGERKVPEAARESCRRRRSPERRC